MAIPVGLIVYDVMGKPMEIARSTQLCALGAALAIPALSPAQVQPCVDYDDYLHWVLRQPTPEPVVERIEALRRQHWTGLRIAAEVGAEEGIATGAHSIWRSNECRIFLLHVCRAGSVLYGCMALK